MRHEHSALLSRPWPRRCAWALVLAAAACGARAQDTIHWGWQDAPPDQIVEGPDRDHGRQDRIRTLLQQRLGGYQHKLVVAPFARILEQVKGGQDWCYVNAVRRPDREEWAEFSLPTIINLPYVIMVRVEDKHKFGARGKLSLEALLRNRKFKGSMTRGRSFGPTIDAIVERLPPAEYHANDIAALRMLAAKRIDYVVIYPVRALYTAKQLGVDNRLTTLPFQEGGDAIITHVMCPRNDWGRKVIADVDAVLRTERTTPRYRRLMEAWHDKDAVREIRRLYDSVFLKAK